MCESVFGRLLRVQLTTGCSAGLEEEQLTPAWLLLLQTVKETPLRLVATVIISHIRKSGPIPAT